MFWLNKLREFKQESNMTYKEIADDSGIALTTIEKLFGGRTHDPKLNMITRIVTVLGHTTAELVSEVESVVTLSDFEKDLLFNIRLLDKGGIERVRDTIKSEIIRIEALENAAKCRYNRIYYNFPVSAGTGEFLDNRTAVIAELSEKPPRGTDYILRVSGNSMEPVYHNGDYIYVNSCETVNYGEVGIFTAAGSVYMKEYTKKGLRSYNPEYELIKCYDDVRCLGRVIGKLEGEIEIPPTY